MNAMSRASLRRHGVRAWPRIGRRIAGPCDQGAVAAEFAVVLPAVIVMAVVLMSLARAVTVSMDCQDTAASIARELVVTDGEADASALVQAMGVGASVSVARGGGTYAVSVQCPVLPDPFGVLPTRIRATSTGIVQ
jgi:Flp pilus assembly protein TadG